QGEEWTNKDGWESFKGDRAGSAVTTDSWYGVTVSNNYVTELDLSNNKLKGDMSEAFSGLVSLESLILSDNKVLAGTLPSELARIESLDTLNICRTGVSEPANNMEFNMWLASIDYTGPQCSTPTTPTTQPTTTPSSQPSSPPPPSNRPPEADAGDDMTLEAGATVTLDGSGSSDPDGDDLTYSWTQTSCTKVTLEGYTMEQASFTAPLQSVTLRFELEVSDRTLSDTDSVIVTVRGEEPDSVREDEGVCCSCSGCSVASGESGRSGLFGMALNLLLIMSVLLVVRNWL
ncbi:MAG: PKD domain-containing protein, partial [Candidatus Dadabacteria bacterium]|nr:PKD domain-containing protein [Candidatus Dadabacteria bacterium]